MRDSSSTRTSSSRYGGRGERRGEGGRGERGRGEGGEGESTTAPLSSRSSVRDSRQQEHHQVGMGEEGRGEARVRERERGQAERGREGGEVGEEGEGESTTVLLLSKSSVRVPWSTRISSSRCG